MKVFKGIVLAVGALIVLALVVSLFLPSTFSVQRTDVVPGTVNAIYARFAKPRTWSEWSAWTTSKDPTLHYQYEGPDSGVGATMKWTSKGMGDGRLTIVEAVPGDHVRYELRMAGTDMSVHGLVRFEPAGGATRITWHDRGSLGSNPLYRLLTPVLDRALGGAFEQSFANLKRLAGNTVPS
jgi:hypothetical protein